MVGAVDIVDRYDLDAATKLVDEIFDILKRYCTIGVDGGARDIEMRSAELFPIEPLLEDNIEARTHISLNKGLPQRRPVQPASADKIPAFHKLLGHTAATNVLPVDFR